MFYFTVPFLFSIIKAFAETKKDKVHHVSHQFERLLYTRHCSTELPSDIKQNKVT